MQTTPSGDRLVVAGNLNGRVGRERVGFEDILGGHGLREVNEQGDKILEFAVSFQLVILNTLYQKCRNHLLTYYGGGSCTTSWFGKNM